MHVSSDMQCILPFYEKIYYLNPELYLLRWLPEPLALAGVWESTIEPITDTSCIDALVEAEEIQEAESHRNVQYLIQ